MALPTFVPPYLPSPGTSTTPEIKLKKAEFGDGYTQTTRDGLNHLRRVVELTWAVLTVEQAAAMESFFVARGGDEPFYYALSDDTTRKWTCETFSRVRDHPNSITATFRECFTPEN